MSTLDFQWIVAFNRMKNNIYISLRFWGDFFIFLCVQVPVFFWMDEMTWAAVIFESVERYRADSRLAPSQWETLLQSNTVSHWLGANLGSALNVLPWLSLSSCLLFYVQRCLPVYMESSPCQSVCLGVGEAVRFLVVGTIGKEKRPPWGQALDGAVFDFTQILAYPVHNMSRSQLYLELDYFGCVASASDILTGLWLNSISSVESTFLYAW